MGRTRLPVSVLPRAKIRIALGQAEELPLSSSVLDVPNWRACSSIASDSGMMMGEAAVKAARMVTAKNFILMCSF